MVKLMKKDKEYTAKLDSKKRVVLRSDEKRHRYGAVIHHDYLDSNSDRAIANSVGSDGIKPSCSNA